MCIRNEINIDFHAVSTYVTLLSELDGASNDGDSRLISLLFSSPTPHVAGKDINQQSLPQRLVAFSFLSPTTHGGKNYYC